MSTALLSTKKPGFAPSKLPEEPDEHEHEHEHRFAEYEKARFCTLKIA